MNRALTLPLMMLASTALADSAGGLTWKVPAGWTTDAPRPMRAATYQVGPVKGDQETAEVAVFYFGEGQGGGVDANLKRWIGQFEQPGGKSSERVAKINKETVKGLPITTVDVSGTYTAAMGPMAPKTQKPQYRMLGAIVEGPQGAVFFKMTGPAKTVAAAQKDFRKLIESLGK